MSQSECLTYQHAQASTPAGHPGIRALGRGVQPSARGVKTTGQGERMSAGCEDLGVSQAGGALQRAGGAVPTGILARSVPGSGCEDGHGPGCRGSGAVPSGQHLGRLSSGQHERAHLPSLNGF